MIENSNTVMKNNEITNDFQISKSIRRNFPLTEWSKRKMAAKFRKEHKKKSERIEKVNAMITHGAEVIVNHSKKTHVKKIESLIKINNNQLYRDRSFIYDSSDLQRSSFNEKIEALELKLRKIENELMMEKNRLANVEEEPFDGSQINYVSDEIIANTNIINTSEEIAKMDLPNLTTCCNDRSKLTNIISLDNRAYQTPSNLETSLVFSPKCIKFKTTIINSNSTNCSSKQQIKISNRSTNTVFCHYSRIIDSDSVLRDDMNVIEVKSVANWCRLRPGMTVDYLVTFTPVELPNYKTYLDLEGVKLVFETANSHLSDLKNVFYVPLEFCMIRPEPELVTKTIIFPIVRDSKKNNNPKKFLVLKNNGDVECVFSVFKETDLQKTYNIDGSNCSFALNLTETKSKEKHNSIFEDIIDSIINKVFSNFVWKNHINVLLPAKGTVKVPVMFNQNLADSSVSERYIIMFNHAEYTVPYQMVTVVGHVNEQNIRVKPDVVDVGLCYLASSEQVVSFHLQNNSRVVVPFEVKLPKELLRHVTVSPSKGYLKAKSSMEIYVRLSLKYDILQQPNSCKTYFNGDSGFLDFPIRVCPSDSKKSCEVRVLAMVTTSFGLKLTPNVLDFGTVHTTETVVRSLTLANHSRTAVEYGFLKLPERVSVFPNAFGTIFSGEQIGLLVHYSPSAKDLPQRVHAFEDNFTLTCSTITGLNADIFNNKIETTSRKTSIEETSTLSINQSSAVNTDPINELNHGSIEVEIPKLNNLVAVKSLNENDIFDEATITCRASVHDIPVELSVQKIVFKKTHFTSYSTFTIELIASNLASIIERNIVSFPDFKIRFEFVSSDPFIEFKPKNGILQSREVIRICVILRPKFDDELRNMYEECLNCEATNIKIEQVLKDENSIVNKVYKNKPFLHEQIKIFEANETFYSSMTDKTKMIPAVCFVQFVDEKSIEYFGFNTGSLKLSLVCPTTKPNIVLFSDRIYFGKRTAKVRHDEWLLVRNVTTHPVPLRISPADPIGPFFCAFALNGEQLLQSGVTTSIKISFTPERESMVNETLEIISGTMKLTVELLGCGVRPTCEITPNDMFNIIQTTHEHLNNKYVFRVTNTSETGVWFNVQMEWARERLEPMTDDEACGLVETIRAADLDDRHRSTALLQLFDGPRWTELEDGENAFDLGNGRRPLRFHLDPNDANHVQVVFRPSPVPLQDSNSPSTEEFRRRVYVAKFNVHVGRSVLHRFYVFGFIDLITAF